MSKRTSPAQVPESRLRSFLHLLWITPVLGIAFGLFFGVMNGASREAFIGSYIAALFFGYPIGICMWTLEHFVLPRVAVPDAGGRPRMVLRFSLYGVASLVGVFTGVLALRLTLAPH